MDAIYRFLTLYELIITTLLLFSTYKKNSRGSESFNNLPKATHKRQRRDSKPHGHAANPAVNHSATQSSPLQGKRRNTAPGMCGNAITVDRSYSGNKLRRQDISPPRKEWQRNWQRKTEVIDNIWVLETIPGGFLYLLTNGFNKIVLLKNWECHFSHTNQMWSFLCTIAQGGSPRVDSFWH